MKRMAVSMVVLCGLAGIARAEPQVYDDEDPPSPPRARARVPAPAPISQAPAMVPRRQPRPEPGPERYGWQILAVDAGTIIASASLARIEEKAVGPVLAAGWSLGAPAVHVAHGNPGRAVGSLALHLALPALGLAAGSAASDCENSEEFLCGLGEAAAGLVVGGLLATAIDAHFLAIEPVERRAAPEQRRGPRAIPMVAASGSGLALGLHGRF